MDENHPLFNERYRWQIIPVGTGEKATTQKLNYTCVDCANDYGTTTYHYDAGGKK
jgi:hypothetical protein